MNSQTSADVGAASNFLISKALFNAGMNLIGNLASQTNNPCFSGFYWSWAGIAALLGGTGGFNNIASKVTNNNAYVGREVAIQAGHNFVAGSL